MNTWDVVLLRFPFNDAGGTVKMRPALVVSKNEYHNSGQDGLFILMTGNTEREAHYDVKVDRNHPEFGRTGLLKDTSIRVDKIMNLRTDLVCRVLGSLGPTLKASVQAKLSELWQI